MPVFAPNIQNIIQALRGSEGMYGEHPIAWAKRMAAAGLTGPPTNPSQAQALFGGQPQGQQPTYGPMSGMEAYGIGQGENPTYMAYGFGNPVPTTPQLGGGQGGFANPTGGGFGGGKPNK